MIARWIPGEYQVGEFLGSSTSVLSLENKK